MLRCESRVGKGEARAAASSRGIGAEALVGMCGEGQQGLDGLLIRIRTVHGVLIVLWKFKVEKKFAVTQPYFTAHVGT